MKRYLIRLIRYFYRKGLKNNRDLTLITNNCIGGVIYHDMQLKFMSPTINLYFSNSDFITFCINLKEYLNTEIKEYTRHDKKFPVGIIEGGGKGDVLVYFMHYNSFSDAKNKWNERIKRVNYENLFIIMESQIDTEEHLLKFNDIPFKNKVLLTNGKSHRILSSFPISSKFYNQNYYPGKLLMYPKNGLIRYLEQFDYVYFFNTGKIRKRRFLVNYENNM